MGILSSMLESKVSDKIVLTPVKIATDMIEILPDDVWNKDTKFLDSCCKSGVYLKLIYDKLMKKLSNVIENEEERSTHILNNQLYGLGMDEFCTAVSQRRLYGSMKSDCNIKHIKNYTRMVQGSIKKYKEELERAFGENMRFDVVISNPPYNRGMDLDFVNKGFDLCEQYCVMITPAKWQTAADDQRVVSKTINYGKFREKLVPHMSKVVFYPDCVDVFTNIALRSGVTYFMLNKEFQGECEVTNIIGKHAKLCGKQIRSITGRKTLMNCGNDIINYISPYNKIRLTTVNKDDYYVYCSNMISCGGAGHGKGITLLQASGSSYILSEATVLKDTDSKPLSNVQIPFFSGKENECKSFASYLNTRFVRFFIIINISSDSGVYSDDYFRFVPAPPSGKFDHIYTDEELYKAFNLPQKYIDVIEAVIKERT